MAEGSYEREIKVLVTGFGAFLDVKNNPSWCIVSKMPAMIDHRGVKVRVIVHNEPLKAEYHHLIDIAPKLIMQHNPDAVVHIGLAMERSYFAIEKGAFRDGYQQFPDTARKVVTKAETRELWGKSPARLDTGLDLEEILRSWKGNLPKGKGKAPDLRLSDDVGTYVCGLVYYASMEYMWRNGNEQAKVVFLHVPPLRNPKDLEIGGIVTTALLKAVTEGCEI